MDDAHGYLNERGVGQGIVDSGVPREEIWLTSKFWPSDFENVYQALDEMLNRLGVEYLDLVYLHHPAGDIETIISAWQGLEQAYREGKVRALGISNFDNRMEAFNAIMEQEIHPQIMQIECHPFAQRQGDPKACKTIQYAGRVLVSSGTRRPQAAESRDADYDCSRSQQERCADDSSLAHAGRAFGNPRLYKS